MADIQKSDSNKPFQSFQKNNKKEGNEEGMRQVPQALGPEKSILSLLTLDSATYISRCIGLGVSEDYFYLPAHQILWNIFSSRYSANLPTDIVSVAQALSDQNQLEAVGGHAGLTEIYNYTTTGAYFEHHIEILRDKFILRSIISTTTEAATRAFDSEEEVASLLDTIEKDIFSIRERSSKSEDDASFTAILNQAIANFEDTLKRAEKGTGVLGLTTGYEELDKRCNGLKAGDMFVIAARPSMGKTSFLLNIIEHIALDVKKPALMFSCEMPAPQIAERLLFARAGISRNEILRRKTLTKNEMGHFGKAIKELREAKLIIDDTAGISINELRAKARRVVRELGQLSVIGIDYLQLMKSNTKQAQNSREREVAEISAGLKALAKELKIPVIVLAQLNRGPESRTGSSMGKPMMSDLRESGAIEQDADMIGLLYRPGYYAKDEEERQALADKAVLTLAKNRNGAVGNIPLSFTPELMKFASRERDENEMDED